ncbi:unnamed protein product [Chilo suppressalis]|uniref:Odorant receptor n=1 Tax=Chilo suppressalis TaxID=168631 RepID=A0ABN8B2A0_CHISP|nr:unnamed protein product [Chilo suppressalis]
MKVRSLMHYLDTWPYAVFGENVSPYPFRGRKFLFVTWTLTFYVCAWFLITSIGVVGFIELAQCYITIFLNCVGTTSSQFEVKEDPLFYSSEEDKMIKNILIENIEHYIMINKFLDKYAVTFGSSYCALYLFHQDASSLSKYGCLTFMVMQQLIQMSVVVELVTSKSEKVMNAVYSVPWERMSASNRKMVAVFLLNAQNPMEFKAMGIVSVGVQTMAAN